MFSLTDPLIPSSSFHSCTPITLLNLSIISPVLVADCFVTDPEPQIHHAGVAQSHPYVRTAGILGSPLHPSLLVRVSDGDQVSVVQSAVIQGFLPGLVFIDQNQFICQKQSNFS